jgi:hypothetical protein
VPLFTQHYPENDSKGVGSGRHELAIAGRYGSSLEIRDWGVVSLAPLSPWYLIGGLGKGVSGGSGRDWRSAHAMRDIDERACFFCAT